MNTLLTAAAWLMWGASSAMAQAPVFEVATIRPSQSVPGGQTGFGIAPGGRFTSTNTSLRAMIRFAYDVRDFQITGGPNWLDSDRFDIVAKPETEIARDAAGNEKLRLMLRALLTERFRLAIHRDTKEETVYSLVAGRNGPKIALAGPDSKGPQLVMTRGTLTAQKIPLDMFVKTLAGNLGRDVIDNTGLTGEYDFSLRWTPEAGQQLGPLPGQEDREGASIFTALQEQLGLKLESKKAPVEIIVVDHAEKALEN